MRDERVPCQNNLARFWANCPRPTDRLPHTPAAPPPLPPFSLSARRTLVLVLLILPACRIPAVRESVRAACVSRWVSQSVGVRVSTQDSSPPLKRFPFVKCMKFQVSEIEIWIFFLWKINWFAHFSRVPTLNLPAARLAGWRSVWFWSWPGRETGLKIGQFYGDFNKVNWRNWKLANYLID